MKRRLTTWVGCVLGVALVAALVLPVPRTTLEGLIRGERFGDGRSSSYWIGALKDRDAEVRHQAAKELGAMGPEAGEAAAPALAEALKDDDDLVRLNAALALFKMGPKAQAAAPELAATLKDRRSLIRLDAVLALHSMGARAKVALPALIEALKDDANGEFIWPINKSVREMAARSLGRIGPDAREAIPALAEVVKQHRNEPEYQAAGLALKQIDPAAATRAGVP